MRTPSRPQHHHSCLAPASVWLLLSPRQHTLGQETVSTLGEAGYPGDFEVLPPLPDPPLYPERTEVQMHGCCYSVPQLNTPRVTRYVQKHLYMYKYKYTAQGERIACATVFNDPTPALRLGTVLSPFLENEVCYVRSLPWLQIIPTQDITTVYCSLRVLASIN